MKQVDALSLLRNAAKNIAAGSDAGILDENAAQALLEVLEDADAALVAERWRHSRLVRSSAVMRRSLEEIVALCVPPGVQSQDGDAEKLGTVAVTAVEEMARNSAPAPNEDDSVTIGACVVGYEWAPMCQLFVKLSVDMSTPAGRVRVLKAAAGERRTVRLVIGKGDGE